MALEQGDYWINRSKSGKGFVVRAFGQVLTGNMKQLERFVNGEIDGVKLSKVVK